MSICEFCPENRSCARLPESCQLVQASTDESVEEKPEAVEQLPGQTGMELEGL